MKFNSPHGEINEIVICFPKYSFHDDLIISKAGGLMCYIVLLKKMWLFINMPYPAIFVEVLNTRCLPKLTGFKNTCHFFQLFSTLHWNTSEGIVILKSKILVILSLRLPKALCFKMGLICGRV